MTFEAVRGAAMHGEAWYGLACRAGAVPGSARKTGGRSAPQFDSAAPARGWARHGAVRRCEVRQGFNNAGPGSARRGRAGQGMGGWQHPGFDASAPAQGPAWHVEAGCGAAARGLAGSGLAGMGVGEAGRGKERQGEGDWQPLGFEAPAPTHEARLGLARCGLAMRGRAGDPRAISRDLGCDSPALTRQGMARRGKARHGWARLVRAGRCSVRRGWPWRGNAGGRQASRFEPSTPTQLGWAWHGRSGSGTARLGAAPALQGQARHGHGGRVAHIRVRVPDARARRGPALQGKARLRAARSGLARHGAVRRGMAGV
jgi:hypothetical protein